MNHTKFFSSISVFCLILACNNAQAVTLLDVTGPDTDFTNIMANQSAGVSFTLNQAYNDITITPDVFCLGCTGRFVLMQDNVGSSATLSDLVGAIDHNGGQADTLSFTGLFEAADYFLIFIVDSGTAGWIGGSQAVVNESSGASLGISLFSDVFNTDTTFPGASNFTALFSVDHYLSVTGTPVPLPAGAWLLLSALTGLISLRVKS